MMQLLRLALATATVWGIPFINAVKIGDKVSTGWCLFPDNLWCEHIIQWWIGENYTTQNYIAVFALNTWCVCFRTYIWCEHKMWRYPLQFHIYHLWINTNAFGIVIRTHSFHLLSSIQAFLQRRLTLKSIQVKRMFFWLGCQGHLLLRDPTPKSLVM